LIATNTSGIFLTFIIALGCFLATNTYLSPVPMAILIGLLLNPLIKNQKVLKPGIEFVEKEILNISIILLGANLFISFDVITIEIILILFLTILLSIIFCFYFGNLLGLPSDLSILIGVGNGICGSSAIAATSKVIDTKENHIGISITIINLLSVVSMFILPLLLTNKDEVSSGLIIGSSIQAVGQVAGAGSYDSNVEFYAILFKMIRILMLGPAILLIGYFYKQNKKNKLEKNSNLIPSFIIGFVVLACFVNIFDVPKSALDFNIFQSKFLLTMAMAAIGLKISFLNIFKYGFKPVFVALIGNIIQIIIVILFVTYFL